MLKFIVVFLVAAVIEVIQVVTTNKNHYDGKKDQNALEYIAHRVDTPSLGYVPGRRTYDEKHKLYVTDYKYEWEYQGKKHVIDACDDPHSRYSHYMATFPDEITITIHRKTGGYYIPKNERTREFKYLASMAISLILSYYIVSLFM